MNTKNFTKAMLLGLLMVLVSSSAFAGADPEWTGQGDGTSWSDPDNWLDSTIPVDGDVVYIYGNYDIEISQGEVVIGSLYLYDNVKLTVNTHLHLLTGNGASLYDDASLVIDGEMTIDSDDDGFYIRDDASVTINGQAEIVYAYEDGIDMEDNGKLTVNGTLNVSTVEDEEGIEMDDDTEIYVGQSGYLEITDVEYGNGIELDDDPVVTNYGTIVIKDIKVNNALDLDDSDSRFYNYGQLVCQNLGDYNQLPDMSYPLIVIDDGEFHNYSGAQVILGTLFGVSLEIESGADFYNYSNSVLQVSAPFFETEAIYMEGGDLENDGQITLGNTVTAPSGGNGSGNAPFGGPFITLSESAEFLNDCNGTIEAGPFYIDNQGSFINQGQLSSSWAEPHFNYGEFINYGTLNSPLDFTASPIPISGGDFTGVDIGWAPQESDYKSPNPCNNSTSYDISTQYQNWQPMSDNIAFYQYNDGLCGDGMITAKIENVSPTGFAGLMIRESDSPGAKQVGIFSNLGNVLRYEARMQTDAPKTIQAHYRPFPFWLRLQRQGNWVFAYYSTTGSTFSYVHASFLPMGSCVEIGMAAFSNAPYSTTSATFSHVTVDGGQSNYSLEQDPGATPLQAQSEAFGPQLDAKIFPVPARNQFTLELTQPLEGNAEAILMNTLGQQVGQRIIEGGSNSLQWDVSQFPAGQYLISIRTEDGQVLNKQLSITN